MAMITAYLNKLFIPAAMRSGSPYRRMLGKLYAACIEMHPATSGCGTCGNYMLSIDTRACHAAQPDFPVDVVYTWVDGADPAHQAKRQAHLPAQGDIHDNGIEPARFRDNEELRYSLRALERFAPWVRSIIIVTDSQTPAWLCTDHPKIRIVDHKDFIPRRYLPTFNSHVIEAFLHMIPGLAEHYIYLNDDVFLARHCRKTDFFTSNGLPMAFVDWRHRRLFGYKYTKTPHAMSYFNTLALLQKKGEPTDQQFITAHGPYAQTRTNASDAFAFYQEIINAFAQNKFRTTNEIAMYSHGFPLWLYAQKRLVPCDERYYYVQTRRRDRAAYYTAILHSQKDHVPPLFFCINDVEKKGACEQWRMDLHTLLSIYYPTPSPCERDFSQNNPPPAPPLC